MTDGTIIIAGGGIGGLAAALGLARKGYRSVVLEQASKFGEIGAGIQIGPNAFHAFDWLGVGDEARAKAVYIDNLILMDAVGGEEIVRLELGDDFRSFFRNPYAVVHRSDLHDALLHGCQASDLIELHTDARVEGYEQDGASVTVTLADSGTVTGAALIGADGLRSRIREKVVGDGEPRVSGHTTYRSVIPVERMPEDLRWSAATLWAGPKIHIVHYPLKGWKVFNLVATCHDDAPEPVTGKPVPKDQVLANFTQACEQPRRILEQGDDWKLWVLCDRDPVRNWIDGRVTLLGDAAHPMLQYFAQGACMALEDAVCLAHMMEARSGDIDRAFAAYNAQRAARTARVQTGSRLIGDYIYHPAGAMADLRNSVMRSFSQAEWRHRLEWLYGGTGLESAV
jgi:2-polyprenyl-6-methoxyphenol hydroxylase-like FAD-dependent oxidoreductase